MQLDGPRSAQRLWSDDYSLLRVCQRRVVASKTLASSPPTPTHTTYLSPLTAYSRASHHNHMILRRLFARFRFTPFACQVTLHHHNFSTLPRKTFQQQPCVSASLSTLARAASRPVMPAGSFTGTYVDGYGDAVEVRGDLPFVVWSRAERRVSFRGLVPPAKPAQYSSSSSKRE
jgi:hypothetical protein